MGCQYVFKSEESEDYDEWSCPHDTYSSPEFDEELSYCIFHIPLDIKKEYGISGEEIKEELIKKVRITGERNKEFIGAKFKNLDLDYLKIGSEDHYPIDISHSTIEKNVKLSYSSINQPLLASHCDFNGDFIAKKSDFQSLTVFSGSRFCNRTDFTGAEFKDDVYFTEVVFEGDKELLVNASQDSFNLPNEISYYSANFSKSVYFDDTKFRGVTSFHSCVFRGEARFTRSKFKCLEEFDIKKLPNFKRIGPNPLGASFHSATFESAGRFYKTKFPKRIDLRGVKAQKLRFSNTGINVAFFGGSEIKDISFYPRPCNELAYISFGSATVENGSLSKNFKTQEEPISGPEDIEYSSGDIYYDFSNAKLGDVNIREANVDILEYSLFQETEFDGFNFTKYRHRLSPNWDIHTYNGPTVRSVKSPLTEYKGESSLTALENTYLNAKNGAKRIGDGEASSQFLIKEMRYRRRRWWNEIRKSENSRTNRFWYTLRWLANGLTDLISVYGEKPRRVVWVSLGVLFFSTFLYPLSILGGIVGTQDGQPLRYTYSMVSDVNIYNKPIGFLLELGSILQESFYFSVVTFTTLGYGDIQPGSWPTQTIASFEAFVGSFLIAFFVFSLGKQITR